MAFLLLIAALVFFWISTRQIRQPWRTLIWIVGAALTTTAASSVISDPAHFGVLRAVADLGNHIADPENSVLVSTLKHNAGATQRFLPQFIDVALIAATIIGVLCLVAFTRGEGVERATRPLIFWLVGVLCGGALALAIVAIGFGGQVRPSVYVGELIDQDVHDGDTFWLGETPLRLWAVDAPERSQRCRGTEREDCGEWARERLVQLAKGALITCTQRRNSANSRMDSFGRPLVECIARRGDEETDLGRQMVAEGFAVQFKDRDFGLGSVERGARNLNVMAGCTIRPEEYRGNTQARRAWRADFTIVPGTATMGSSCPTALP